MTPSRKPQRQESRPNLGVLLLIGIFPLLLLELARLPVIDAFEHAASDARMRLRNSLDPREISDRIAVVGVSDLDEALLGEDLKDRQAYSELIARLRADDAASVTFDIFFVAEQEKDVFFAMALQEATPPAVIAYSFWSAKDPLQPHGDLPEEFLESEELSRTGTDPKRIADDILFLDGYLIDLKEFERELRGNPEAMAENGQEVRRRMAWTLHLRDALLRRWFVIVDGRNPANGGSPYEAKEIRLLSPALMLAAKSRGFANVEKGTEDVVRTVPLVYTYNDRLFPSLSLATALLHFDVPFSDARIEWGRAISFEPKQNGPATIRIPIDERGRYRVNYREGEAYLNRNRLLSAVLRGDDFGDALPPGYFRNKLVLVGEVIAGGPATDVEPIPLQPQFPMVGMHANVLDNILRADFLHDLPQWLRVLIAAGLGATASIFFFLFSFPNATRLTLLMTAAYVVAQFFLFQAYGYMMPIVQPVLGLSLALLFFFGYVIVVKDRDRRLVRDVFMKSVSPRIGEEILKNFNDDAIWGAQREITVLFIDVRGYTTMSEEHGPDAVLDMLDQFYDTVSEAVFRHDGQVNKFLGDAVLALFGALAEETPNHAERAVKAAAEIQAAMVDLNEKRIFPQFGIRMSTGAGVNTGIATVGLVGRRRIRIEYTALGDAVNVAARLQAQATEGEVAIAETTLEQVGPQTAEILRSLGMQLQPAESIAVKGKKLPVALRRAVPASRSSTSIPMEKSS